jgi:WD40 repeat protein
MLLARESVNLDPSTETKGTLLATLLRSPAAIATFTLPIEVRPCCGMTLSPDGRTLAVSDNSNNVRFIDTRTRRARRVLSNFGATAPVTYSRDGSLLVDFGGAGEPAVEVLDARTFRVERRLHLDRQWLHVPTDGLAPFLVTPDNRTVLYVYDLILPNGDHGQGFVDRWDVRTGKLIATVSVGAAGANAATLVDGGQRLAIAGSSQVTYLDTATLRKVRSVPIPGGVVSSIDSSGRFAAVGSDAGSVSFVDLSTGHVTPSLGGHAAAVERLEFSRDGRTLVTTADDGSVLVRA